MKKMLFFLRKVVFSSEWSWRLYNKMKCFRLDKKIVDKVRKNIGDTTSVYYVLQRKNNPGSGLCALLNEYLGELRLVDAMGWIPVVDLKSYANALIDSKYVGKKNGWDDFFYPMSNVTLEKVESLHNVYYSTVDSHTYCPKWDMRCLNSKKEIEIWRRLFNKYIRLNDETQKFVDKEFEKLEKYFVEGVCGVLLRGTDYAEFKPSGHPIQPTIDEAKVEIDKMLKRTGCKYIFLATEDKKIYKELQKIYGNRIIVDSRKMYDSVNGKTLTNIENRRTDDRYYSTLEYIATLYILSKCKCLVSGRTSASPIILMLNDDKYDAVHFFELGEYE